MTDEKAVRSGGFSVIFWNDEHVFYLRMA